MCRRKVQFSSAERQNFISMHVTRRLLEIGQSVIGLDNLNDYYDPRLKDRAELRSGASPGMSEPHKRPADHLSLEQGFSTR